MGRFSIVFSIGMLMAFTGCSKFRPAENAVPLTLAQQSCANFRASLPKDYIQDFVEVPEDYANSQGPKTHVFYYGRIGNDTIGSIVFFNGGPSSSSQNAHATLAPITDQRPDVRASLPILYVDQRGTGCSDAYPAPFESSDGLERLSHYASTEIVKDSEVIRKKLKIGKWKVFGQSYGGLIAKRYLQIAPEGVRSIHVHGFAASNNSTKILAERLKSQELMIQDYFNEYPEDRRIYLKVEDLLTAQTCVHASQTLCGKPILYSLTSLLGFYPQRLWIHFYLNRFLDHEQLNMQELKKYLEAQVFSNTGEAGFWAGVVINWVDLEIEIYGPHHCREAYDYARSHGDAPESWTLHECKNAMSSSADEEWDRLVQSTLQSIPRSLYTLDVEAEALRRSPEIPFFLYSGDKDSFVPSASFKDEVEQFGPRIHYHNFPLSGHEGFSTELEIWTHLMDDHESSETTSP